MRALWLGLALLLTGCGPSRVEQLEAENQNLKIRSNSFNPS